MDNKRRSSTGRSKILESSILIISEFIKTKDLEDFYSYVINSTLPGEVRSTAWRIFMGILNKDDSTKWAKTSKELRDNFYKLSTKHLTENVQKYLKLELNAEQAKSVLDEKTLIIITNARKELKFISNNFDFFKTEMISELVVRLVYLWSSAHPEFTNYEQIVTIVAGIVYSLYPSILHCDINSLGIDEEKLENLETQTLFYYLNTEEHFDADVYNLFDCLMEKGIKKFISDHKVYKPISASEVSELIKIDDNKIVLEKVKSLNRVDRIVHFYLRIVNKDLLVKLIEKKIDLYSIIEYLIATLFTKNLNEENIIYYWDCIFVNDTTYLFDKSLEFEDNFLHFTDFIILSYLVLNQENIDKKDFEKIFVNSLPNFDGKDVVKKAIKLREKVNNAFS